MAEKEFEEICQECGQEFYESEIGLEGNCFDCQGQIDEALEMEEQE